MATGKYWNTQTDRATQRALRNFLRGLVADGKNAKGAGTISDLIDWHEANGRAAAALLRDLKNEEMKRKET